MSGVSLRMFAHFYYAREKIKLSLSKKQVYYVFAPAKTATSTYVNTLRLQERNVLVYDGKSYMIDMQSLIDRYRPGASVYTNLSKLKKNCKNHALNDLICGKGHAANKGVRIISGVRCPVSFFVSGVFQRLGRNPETKFLDNPVEIADYINKRMSWDIVEKQITTPLEDLEHKSLLIPLKWHEKYFKKLLGFLPYDVEFDKDLGCGISERDGNTILILSQESDRAIKSDCMRSITGNVNLSLIDKNVGVVKEYAQLYEMTKRYIKLDPCVAEYLKSTKYMNHFYGLNKSEEMLSKWM